MYNNDNKNPVLLMSLNCFLPLLNCISTSDPSRRRDNDSLERMLDPSVNN